jgi:hypothetical protein
LSRISSVSVDSVEGATTGFFELDAEVLFIAGFDDLFAAGLGRDEVALNDFLIKIIELIV